MRLHICSVALDNPNKLNYSQCNKSSTTFASITANDKTPSRDQELVFNSIDGIPQKEYMIAIGKVSFLKI